jgi:resuscitation-promoting factor RpfB
VKLHGDKTIRNISYNFLMQSALASPSSLIKKLGKGLMLLLFLFACQSQSAPRVRLIVDGQVRDIASSDLIPQNMLAYAGVTITPSDRVLLNGTPVPLDQPLQPQAQFGLQLCRAIPVTLIAPNGQITINTAAFSVGEALREAGVSLYVSDHVEPSVETPITSGMTITIIPGRDMVINTEGRTIRMRSSAETVGQLLAEAGLSLVGLDYSSPSETEVLPTDGQIRIVRVTETITSSYKIIPYETELIVTTELQPPAQDVLDTGEAGISLTRTRVRYEDGLEISRLPEAENVIRLPRTRVVQSSYWAAKEFYATSYSPCQSSGEPGVCYYGTSLGIPVARGVVGMIREWYLALKGSRVYIPGYGQAIVADVGAGYPDGRPNIDLGYSDNDYVGWSQWVTVYFLAPAPLQIPWFLQ